VPTEIGRSGVTPPQTVQKMGMSLASDDTVRIAVREDESGLSCSSYYVMVFVRNSCLGFEGLKRGKCDDVVFAGWSLLDTVDPIGVLRYEPYGRIGGGEKNLLFEVSHLTGTISGDNPGELSG